ncbi:hypothetical protein SAMN05660642_03038 [Geodermatophilus siccatus]|uniref:Uncharacterized protein n=1 Tax=Geodermatophilus siccatus TaxID=1137991 RepID=A0A1G9V136_9ACTN|nr:hypothetical protein [Geodermatophilus siccatus]SDM65838.1 hypothetical protein SAMN05660642_03038 [Geodermatophilus siccatus]
MRSDFVAEKLHCFGTVDATHGDVYIKIDGYQLGRIWALCPNQVVTVTNPDRRSQAYVVNGSRLRVELCDYG